MVVLIVVLTVVSIESKGEGCPYFDHSGHRCIPSPHSVLGTALGLTEHKTECHKSPPLEPNWVDWNSDSSICCVVLGKLLNLLPP
jgi:hypothetical protein